MSRLRFASLLGMIVLASAAHAAGPASKTVAFSFTDTTHLGTEASARARRGIEEAVGAAGQAPDDITPVFAALFRPGMLVPDFQKPPPESWPKELAPAWNDGQAACRAKVGPKPEGAAARMKAATAAVECQRQLSFALYARYLEAKKAGAWLEVSVADAEGGADAQAQVTALYFTSRDEPGRRLSVTVPRAKAIEAVGDVAVRVLKGEGSAYTRRLDPRLP